MPSSHDSPVCAINLLCPEAPQFDVVEVMTVRSWSEWERVRDGVGALKPATEAFDELIVGDTVRTVFGTRILPRA